MPYIVCKFYFFIHLELVNLSMQITWMTQEKVGAGSQYHTWHEVRGLDTSQRNFSRSQKSREMHLLFGPPPLIAIWTRKIVVCDFEECVGHAVHVHKCSSLPFQFSTPPPHSRLCAVRNVSIHIYGFTTCMVVLGWPIICWKLIPPAQTDNSSLVFCLALSR